MITALGCAVWYVFEFWPIVCCDDDGHGNNEDDEDEGRSSGFTNKHHRLNYRDGHATRRMLNIVGLVGVGLDGWMDVWMVGCAESVSSVGWGLFPFDWMALPDVERGH